MRTSIESQYSYNKRSWGYPADCDEPALWLANMRDCVLRLRGHPSLLLWCGGNEDPPPKYLGVPMQDKILPELDGTVPGCRVQARNLTGPRSPCRFGAAAPGI